jgi:hypothetical protein
MSTLAVGPNCSPWPWAVGSLASPSVYPNTGYGRDVDSGAKEVVVVQNAAICAEKGGVDEEAAFVVCTEARSGNKQEQLWTSSDYLWLFLVFES